MRLTATTAELGHSSGQTANVDEPVARQKDYEGAESLRNRRECGLGPPYFRPSFCLRIRIGHRGDTVGTIRGWIWCVVCVAIFACTYWVVPSVYSIKYADKIFIDPKPTDCDFWHAPFGTKGCHYQTVVIGRYAKAVREIRSSESDPNEQFDSVLISWVKKSD
jgi:hypothetical protein